MFKAQRRGGLGWGACYNAEAIERSTFTQSHHGFTD